jgi:hypothetical protein
MFDALGLGVGNSLLAAIVIVMGVPFPIFLWFYGERLRARSSLTKYFFFPNRHAVVPNFCR